MIHHASFTRIIIDELDRIIAYIFSLVNIYFDQIIIYSEYKLYYMSYFLQLSIQYMDLPLFYNELYGGVNAFYLFHKGDDE